MRVPFAIALALVAAIVAPTVLVSSHRYASARKALREADTGLHDAVASVQEVIDLRATHQVIGVQQRPTQDVIAQVNSILADVGIPSNQLKSLTPESDALIGQNDDAAAPRLKRQSLRFILENLSIDELGGFLNQWRTTQSMWTVNRIELTHVRDPNPANAHFDANLLISTVYLAEP